MSHGIFMIKLYISMYICIYRHSDIKDFQPETYFSDGGYVDQVTVVV